MWCMCVYVCVCGYVCVRVLARLFLCVNVCVGASVWVCGCGCVFRCMFLGACFVQVYVCVRVLPRLCVGMGACVWVRVCLWWRVRVAVCVDSRVSAFVGVWVCAFVRA